MRIADNNPQAGSLSANRLPNIRRMFIPDPGHIIIDADLSGADAQVVAWEADDEALKASFRAGENIHKRNARELFDLQPTDDPKTIIHPEARKPLYDLAKRAVHATNYAVGVRTLAHNLRIPERLARNFRDRWLSLHPTIKRWHRQVESSIMTSGTVTNPWGYRWKLFERPDNVLPKALAWIPQSTVAITCFRAALRLDALGIDILLQVHDSLVFQIPANSWNRAAKDELLATLTEPIPYEDPLTISWSLAVSDRSWGDVKPTQL